VKTQSGCPTREIFCSAPQLELNRGPPWYPIIERVLRPRGEFIAALDAQQGDFCQKLLCPGE